MSDRTGFTDPAGPHDEIYVFQAFVRLLTEERTEDRLHVATHKGPFELVRDNGKWEVSTVQFLGSPLSAVLADADGTVYAALDLGHFGAKLWRRGPRRLTGVGCLPPIAAVRFAAS